MALSVACGGSSDTGETSSQSSSDALSAAGNREFVTGVYLMYLRRNPEPGGVEFWAQRMDHGETRANIVHEIVLSAEGQAMLQRIGSSHDPVDSAYAVILNRHVDALGRPYWGHYYVTPGYGIGYVVEGLLTSQEFLNDVVPDVAACPGLYRTFQDCIALRSEGEPIPPGICEELGYQYSKRCM
jgi:hypothetical protein